MGRKPQDLTGRQFGLLTASIQLNKEINEDLFTGIVSVNVETQLMFQRQH